MLLFWQYLTLSSSLTFRLVLTDQRPTNKVLYDNDHVIAEGFDLKDFIYNYFSDPQGFLRFQIRNNKSGAFDETLQIRGDPRNQNLSFALESFAHVKEPDTTEDKFFCRQNTSENLRHLIALCHNTIRMRNLTEEEREQLQQFKNERRGECNSLRKQVCEF